MNRYRFKTYVLFFVLVHFMAFEWSMVKAQSPEINDLKSQLEQASDDSTRINTLWQLGEQYLNINRDSAKHYRSTALDIAKQSNNQKWLSIANYKMAEISVYESEYDNGQAYAFEAMRLWEISNDTFRITFALGLLAYSFEMQGMYDSAMVYSIHGLKLNEQIKDSIGIAESYRHLAAIHQATGEPDKSLRYNLLALEIFEKYNNKFGMSMQYLNTGNVFSEISKPDSALLFYEKGLALAEELGDTESKATILHNMGAIALKQKRFNVAEAYHLESLELRQKLGISDHISLSYSSIGSLYSKQGKYAEAREYFLKSIELGRKISARQRLLTAYQGLSELDVKLGDYAGAYEYLQKFSMLKDSMLNESKTEQIASLEVKYQAEKKQSEIDLLKKDAEIHAIELKRQKDQRNAIAIGIVLVGLLAFGLYRRNRYRLKVQKEKEEKDRALKLEKEKTAFEKQKVEQLERVDQLKDAFLANTSHELRTPLHGIIGLAQSMLERSHEPVDIQDLDMIIYSGNRLATLVNDILDFSKLKSHAINLNQKAVDGFSAIEIVLKMCLPLTKGKHVELINNYDKRIPPLYVDENRFQQVLVNLIGNAIKFTNEGQVSIDGNVEDRFVFINVVDTGIGIKESQQSSIFDSFTQLEDSEIRNFDGTGLGLSITKQLVELHGGHIQVHSTPGEGSTFTCSFPIAEAGAIPIYPLKRTRATPAITTVALPTESTEDHALNTGIGDETFRILVVDDDPVNQQVLKNYLSGGSFSVTQALNGSEALKHIESGQKFDVVLLDIMMPGMSGYEVCEKIRGHYLPNELPVLMVTAKNQMNDLVEAFELKANDYLLKPISKAELLARLSTHLNLLHINQSYSRFIPKEIFKVLGHENVLDVKLGDQVEEDVTVLFSDIRSYTTLAESMSVSDTFQLLNGYLSRVVPIINSHHGLVHQFLGDGILAIFRGNPKHAIEASIAYQQMLVEYNKERVKKGRTPLRVGIGLNTGSLMLGIIGDEQRQGAIVVSDTVNTTSRLEGLTKLFGVSIIVGEDTVSQLPADHNFKFRKLGKVIVKGKQNHMDIYDFYEGDLPNEIALKDGYRDRFEKALKLYYNRDFEQALLLFREVIKSNPEDKAAIRYQSNAARFIVSGVPEGWTGIERFDVK